MTASGKLDGDAKRLLVAASSPIIGRSPFDPSLSFDRWPWTTAM
jgi:hypothetical protein